MTEGLPWKLSMSGYEATKDILHKVQNQAANATSIVIRGARPTRVETTGGLGFEYGMGKEITLQGSNSSPESLYTSIAAFAENELKKLHVEIPKDVKTTDSKTTEDGKTQVALSNGELMNVDLYMPTVGVKPNTEFIPKNLLNVKGGLMVDEFLSVKSVQAIWPAGD